MENLAVCWHSKKPHMLDKFHIPLDLLLLLERERCGGGVSVIAKPQRVYRNMEKYGCLEHFRGGILKRVLPELRRWHCCSLGGKRKKMDRYFGHQKFVNWCQAGSSSRKKERIFSIPFFILLGSPMFLLCVFEESL